MIVLPAACGANHSTSPERHSLFRLGRFPLDADGLPNVLADAEHKLPREQRLQKLSAKSLTGPLLPPAVRPYEYGTVLPGSNLGSVQSIHVLSKDAVLAREASAESCCGGPKTRSATSAP